MEILGESVTPWAMFGLVAYSVAVTLVARWLVNQLQGGVGRSGLSLGAVLADLIWMVLVFAAGVIAARYIERLPSAVLGWIFFGAVAFAVSLLRAFLYGRVQAGSKVRPSRDWERWLRGALHQMAYLLMATVLYFLLSLISKQYIDWIFFLPLYFGALLPDLDSRDTGLGRLLPFISRRLEARLGQQGEWHTPAAAALVAVVTAPLIPLVSARAWYLVPLGYLSHLLVDLFTPDGIMLLWPLSKSRYRLLGGPVDDPGSRAERIMVVVLAVLAAMLLIFVDVGPPPPPPTAAPSYEQTLERYYGLRGRNLAIADVEGTWQATGRRVTDRFEILNAFGESYIMLDRYTGRVFTAGRGPDDNLYLNRISVSAGAPAQIKAVELRLQDQRLTEALPVVYEMEREPGLQHIYVSGDLVLPAVEDVASPTLRADYAQTSLRKILTQSPGHYTLSYLTAAELIELANLAVESADLVIIATYAGQDSGPTPTPLPSPPPVLEEGP